MYEVEYLLLSNILAMNVKGTNGYREIDRKVARLVTQTKMSIDIHDDDHGKAIFVFTIITLIFLLMSFATGLLRMNTADIRNQETTRWLFGVISLPITVVVILLVLLVAYRLDEMREWVDKKTKKELRK
jgi:Mg2+ and Co2+ transporter CorA